MQPNTKYTYENAGFNGLLSRSKKANPFADTLADQASSSSGVAINFDRQQVGSSLGNVATVGDIRLDGVNENIIVPDGTNDRLLIGRQDGGF